MILFENSIEFLLNEFSYNKVDIEIKDTFVHDISHPACYENGLMYYPELYNFEFTFNSDFHVDSMDEHEINLEYLKFIHEKEENLLQELDESINTGTSFLKINNQLRSYKLRFNKLLSNYYYEECVYLSVTYNWLRCIVYEENISEFKIINDSKKWKILHSFLVVQKNAIENILKILDDKIDLISSYESSIGEKSKQEYPKDRKAIEKLDQYQFVLLFDYLNKAGVVKASSSYNVYAKDLSKLSGFSQQNLRSKCLPKIWEIKTGKIGNILQIRKDPDYNLKKLKNLIIEINNEIFKDLDKNKTSRD